jgi:2-phospho-L-lactate/phosphoenolpyruvate guanylyltransferase
VTVVQRGPALVIPIKATLGAKQRLSARLTPEARHLLALAMAGDVLRVATSVVRPQRVVVVAGDVAVERLAARCSVHAIRERGAGQSAAVRAGMLWALERGYTSAATMAADCPMASADDVDTLLSTASRRAPFLAAAPDAEGTGTNAAAVRPIDADPWCFGPNSLERHRQAAEANGLRFFLLDLASLRIDCDRPEDLEGVLSMPRPTATFHVLRQLGLARRDAAL